MCLSLSKSENMLGHVIGSLIVVISKFEFRIILDSPRKFDSIGGHNAHPFQTEVYQWYDLCSGQSIDTSEQY